TPSDLVVRGKRPDVEAVPTVRDPVQDDRRHTDADGNRREVGDGRGAPAAGDEEEDPDAHSRQQGDLLGEERKGQQQTGGSATSIAYFTTIDRKSTRLNSS